MTELVPRVTLEPGYDVPRLIVGGWQLSDGHTANPIEDHTILAVFERMVERGFTAFDCADIYRGVERLLGRLAERLRRTRPDLHRRLQIHTKIVPDRLRLPSLTQQHVQDLVDRSLRRLGVDALTLVQFAWWDYAIPGYLDLARWLDDLRRAGKITHLGITNFDTLRTRAILDEGIPLLTNQVQYSLLDARPRQGLVPLCEETGLRLLCYGTVAGGFLSRRWLGRTAPDGTLENRSLTKYRLIIEASGGWSRYQRVLAASTSIGERHGVTPSAVAIRWILEQPAVAAAIVGVRSDRHVDDLAATFGWEFDNDSREELRQALSDLTVLPGDVFDLERQPDGPHAQILRRDLNADAGD